MLYSDHSVAIYGAVSNSAWDSGATAAGADFVVLLLRTLNAVHAISTWFVAGSDSTIVKPVLVKSL